MKRQLTINYSKGTDGRFHPFVTMDVCFGSGPNHTLKWLVDSGATFSIMPYKYKQFLEIAGTPVRIEPIQFGLGRPVNAEMYECNLSIQDKFQTSCLIGFAEFSAAFALLGRVDAFAKFAPVVFREDCKQFMLGNHQNKVLHHV